MKKGSIKTTETRNNGITVSIAQWENPYFGINNLYIKHASVGIFSLNYAVMIPSYLIIIFNILVVYYAHA